MGENTVKQIYRVLFFIVLAAVVILRVKMLDLPLDRGEGECAYAGQLLLQGIPPYLFAYNMKMPGIYAIYAGLMNMMGQTAIAIHIGAMLANFSAALVLLLICLKFFDEITAITASSLFLITSPASQVHGLSAGAENFVLVFALAGILVLIYAAENWDAPLFFVSGLLFGFAFVIKQQALLFILFAFLYGFFKNKMRNLSGYVSMFIGALLPAAVISVFIARAGAFDRFLFWAFGYGSKNGSLGAMLDPLGNFITQAGLLWGFSFMAVILCLCGLPAAVKNESSKNKTFFIYSLFLCSLLAAAGGLYPDPGHLIYFLPAAGITAGVAVSFISTRAHKAGKWLAAALFLAALLTPAVTGGNFGINTAAVNTAGDAGGEDIFAEAVKIGSYIKNHSERFDTVAVMGSEPEIYFYSERKSAAGYIYMYPLMERRGDSLRMQQEMMTEIEAAKPKFIVVINIERSWDKAPGSETFIFGWLYKYLNDNYRMSYAIDMSEHGGSKYYLGKDALGLNPGEPMRLAVMERRIPM